VKTIRPVARESTKVRAPISNELLLEVCRGRLAGLAGTLRSSDASGRAVIQLQPGVYLEVDLACVKMQTTA
jgi:hypothetical protein